jgi:Tol biopolymer transport system component
LVYAQHPTGAVFAVLFDIHRLEVTGTPTPILETVEYLNTIGLASLTFSHRGSLVYLPRRNRSLVWVDRSGTVQSIAPDQRLFDRVRFSPDGQRLATTIGDDLWIYDVTRRTLTRLTFDPGFDYAPEWSPDGKQLVFFSGRESGTGLFMKPADGSGPTEELLAGDDIGKPTSWSADHNVIAFVRRHAGTDIWMLPLDDDKEPWPFLDSSFAETDARFSPDGRWLAYQSDESGRPEIYVRSFPDTGGKWQISSDGGTVPLWSGDGREIFYLNGNRIMAVTIDSETGFSAGKPRLLFEIKEVPLRYDVTPDGKQFVTPRPIGDDTAITQLRVVLNWFEELKRLAPND